jgi:chitinase
LTLPLTLAFVTPSGTADINWDDGSQDTLKKLVSSAHKSGHGTKIVLSVGEVAVFSQLCLLVEYMRAIGGWGGSHWFCQAMSTPGNRSKLVKTLSAIVDMYHLDGKRSRCKLDVYLR